MTPAEQVAASSEGELLRAAAAILAERPFGTVSLNQVAEAAGTSPAETTRAFASMHDVGTTILDHERASMRLIQERSATSEQPFEQIVMAFRAVGENLADDIVVRAGVRIAQESRSYFPERRLDPVGTWEGFVTARLTEAARREWIRGDIAIERAAQMIVIAGLGAKELVRVRGTWPDAPNVLANAAADILTLIARIE